MKERKIITTKDGSASIFVPELNEHYHSIHGAVQESAHVFIQMGLQTCMPQETPIEILEIGWGTGLNALMTLSAAGSQPIRYTGVEKFPLEQDIWGSLAYPEAIQRADLTGTFAQLHQSDWESWQSISPTFQQRKLRADFESFEPGNGFQIIYFDAFAPEKQPELWTEAIFEKMFRLTQEGGILVTYCAKGAVRRAMQAAGFQIEKLPGPPGKREMLRARKISL